MGYETRWLLLTQIGNHAMIMAILRPSLPWNFINACEQEFAHEKIDAKISYVVEIAQAHQDLLCVRIIRPVCVVFGGGGAVKMHILFTEISSF